MIVELKNIHKAYGRVQANAGIDLRLESGRIYGLLGENGAGKSTLMRVLAGHTRPDHGELLFEGRPEDRLSPARAMRLGVGMLYQDPLDFPAMKVWENFQVGGRKRTRAQVIERLADLSAELGFELPPHAAVGELTVGERQQLELVRLMEAGARVLILDEPTTGISVTQKETLFKTLGELRAKGDRVIIMVTHKLAEALELCDDIFIMRQGRLVDSFQPPYRPDQILGAMFGPETLQETDETERPAVRGEKKLELEDVHFVGEKYDLTGVTLDAHAGEIIGLAGLEGNGQELLLRGLAGLVRTLSGRISFEGQPMDGRPYLFFRRRGIHFLPAARIEQGLFPDMSLTEHVTLAFPEQRASLPEYFQRICVEKYQLMAAPSTSARALSGGNQQRLLLSLIPAEIRMLLMEHPTRGLDVGSARQVWFHLEERCRKGAALFFSSADLDEILAHSHRVLVFYNRRIIADIPIEEAGMELVGGLMAGRDRAA